MCAACCPPQRTWAGWSSTEQRCVRGCDPTYVLNGSIYVSHLHSRGIRPNIYTSCHISRATRWKQRMQLHCSGVVIMV
mgnify:CR=1 FL=1